MVLDNLLYVTELKQGSGGSLTKWSQENPSNINDSVILVLSFLKIFFTKPSLSEIEIKVVDQILVF